MSISALAYAGLEEALNRYLDLDPATRREIAALHGRVIAFELTGLGHTLYLVPGPDRLRVLARYEGEPDCTLRGTPLALAALRDPRGGPGELFAGRVEMSGDTQLAHRFGRILAAIDIDWEEQLARYTGDLIAHELGNLARGASRWGERSLRTLGLDLQEYLQEEIALLPGRPEIERFLGGVDRLRDDVERLQARIERLTQPAEGASE
ncbi:MAG: SCP2 sterol-binding domain-containing protein [Candidatus Sedimenticola endophacoides]|uniref:Ubiquinone biosynthesis accessory factor UbiJ n=2 Tax=Candidatus Sedimenticola endophacoides TaxID=2548426 RepID=A0A6N4DNB6_9GAMM|nr:MAG: sterol-binding protein [Candidatus Sedimenticola endophacoides]OQX36197.1 MAG: sterol-binding protein [Candidatus Sedimenticola endophacoides]OQX39913.1 MAG: sterol-binding protein [Candidatus Sedimenticola endophacoides]OQX46566.1 MAG: sterol-binding protein [Candidatus Sedimenticola endophacoides]PUD99738.1 MAG: sterol-binding protein [Candidatus Sedimenticola endophacoides]